MYRSIVDYLKEWKNKKRRKPLLVSGVRQCGKTYAVKEFGKECFDNCITLNFEKQQAYKAVFEYDYDVNRILKEIERLSRQKIVCGKTLLFFDEIQECPRAITSLKYFCEDMKELHVIGAGSLLGVALTHKNISFPVGKVNRVQMYPMNFSEFLIARGYENYIDIFKDWPLDRSIPDSYAEPMKKLLQEYYIVGGMPDAVQTWIDENDYESVETVQNEILDDYEDDFGKYAPISELPKIRWIWDSVPVQLARENNKFIFSHVKQGKRLADLEDALQWLSDAGIIYKLHLAKTPGITLSSAADMTYFKVYMSDAGLMRVRSGIAPETILNGNEDYMRYKGAFTENYVLNELLSIGKKPYFWRSGNTAEIDFLFEEKNKVIPVEVKSSENTQAKSYRLFCEKYFPESGFRLSLKNIAENMCAKTRTISLPLYLTWNMNKYL